jgi:hypothetical protein
MQALCAVQLFTLKVAKHTIRICIILPRSSSLYGGIGNLDCLEIQIVLYVSGNPDCFVCHLYLSVVQVAHKEIITHS